MTAESERTQSKVKFCNPCGEETEHALRKNCVNHGRKRYDRWSCRRCEIRLSQARVKRLHDRLKAEAGGKCTRCGYSGIALDWHHRNPEEKSFGISGKGFSFEKLKEEANKCDLVCKNCHAEIHAGLLHLQTDDG